jgi:hypothetical protein
MNHDLEPCNIVTEIKENETLVHKKIVSINEYIEYFYIPTRHELLDKSELWWGADDFKRFQFEACIELREFQKYCPHADMHYYRKNLWLELDFDEIYEVMKELNLVYILE